MPHRVINLSFHGLGDPPRTVTDPIAARQWSSIAEFERILDLCRDRTDVRMTFDDGYASDIGVALPRLLERGMTADFFISAGRLGTTGYLEPEGVKALVAAGMNVGCHGMDHLRWREISDAALDREIYHARAQLEQIIGDKVNDVAIPFGQYDLRVLRKLRTANYQRVFTTDQVPASSPRAWFQPRYTAWNDMNAASLERVLHGEPALSRAFKACKIALKQNRPAPFLRTPLNVPPIGVAREARR